MSIPGLIFGIMLVLAQITYIRLLYVFIITVQEPSWLMLTITATKPSPLSWIKEQPITFMILYYSKILNQDHVALLQPENSIIQNLLYSQTALVYSEPPLLPNCSSLSRYSCTKKASPGWFIYITKVRQLLWVESCLSKRYCSWDSAHNYNVWVIFPYTIGHIHLWKTWSPVHSCNKCLSSIFKCQALLQALMIERHWRTRQRRLRPHGGSNPARETDNKQANR